MELNFLALTLQANWLWTGQPRGSAFIFQQGQEFSLLHVVQISFGVQLVSYPMGTGGSFPRGKAAGA
jgi:hypothetical protein